MTPSCKRSSLDRCVVMIVLALLPPVGGVDVPGESGADRRELTT